MAGSETMTKFTQHVEDYLRLRRSLGYKLHDHARLLRRFAADLDAIGAQFVTIELALSWALEPQVPQGSVVPWKRLLVVRGFARYMVGIDPRTEIPPTGLIRFRQRRRPPFIYSDAEIVALMAQAREGIRQALCAVTYETLIGLLAATGMRTSEAIKLDRTDIDWAEAVLLVRESKFGICRNRHMRHYAELRIRGTRSLSGRCSTLTARASRSGRGSLRCLRIWGIRSQATRIGIWRQRRSCWHSPPSGSRTSDEPAGTDDGGVLYRSADP
jgi:integrase